jgi:2-methylcitrate dehydratase PrpD
MALGIASSHAGGLRAAFGTMTKSLHPGNAARAGVLSAKLAAKGFESNPDVIEDRFGFYAVLGEQQAQLASLTRHLGNPWAIVGRGRDVATGVALKRWPSCGFTHAIATVLGRLLEQHAFKAEEVEAVEVVTTNDPSSMAANIRWPKTPRQGKFSPWYTAASQIVDGKLDLSSFTDEAFERPLVQDLSKRVSIVQDSEMAGRPQRALGGAGTVGRHGEAEGRDMHRRRALRGPRRHLRVEGQGSRVREVQVACRSGPRAFAARQRDQRGHGARKEQGRVGTGRRADADHESEATRPLVAGRLGSAVAESRSRHSRRDGGLTELGSEDQGRSIVHPRVRVRPLLYGRIRGCQVDLARIISLSWREVF